MKKVLAFLALTILIIGTVTFTDFNPENILTGAITRLTTDNEVTVSLQENAAMQIYFCPQDHCAEVFLAFLDTAQNQVYCALHEADHEKINEKLLQLHEDPDIDFKLVIDDNYIDDFNHDFVVLDKSGLMHNKFCVVDNTYVLTGSANPTENGMQYNNNNILIFNSPLLAQNYLDEFDELHNEIFKKGDPVQTEHLTLETNYGEVKVSNYFCPEDNCALHTQEALEQAKDSIHFMTFSFTHDAIENVLLAKHSEGKEVQGVIEARSATQYSPWDVFNYQGIEIYKDGNSKTMHHKVFIIDSETVITGSFNPTGSGDERNDENLLIVKNKAIAELFEEEFDKVFSEAKLASN